MSVQTQESLRLLDAWVDAVCEEIFASSGGALVLPDSLSDAEADAILDVILD